MLYTRAGTPPTAGAFVDGPGTPPLGAGSLQLTTVTGGEKVFLFNYDHVGTDLGDVDDISLQHLPPGRQRQQVAALNLQVDYNGAAAGGFTTLVFEPVYNTDQGAVVSGEWQDWDADGSGRWWSTQPITARRRADGRCFTTWDQIVAANPDAVIAGGVGVNQGSGNPGLTSNVDAFTFDETTYDFERISDPDGDGVEDGSDNCADVANADQANQDGDVWATRATGTRWRRCPERERHQHQGRLQERWLGDLHQPRVQEPRRVRLLLRQAEVTRN